MDSSSTPWALGYNIGALFIRTRFLGTLSYEGYYYLSILTSIIWGFGFRVWWIGSLRRISKTLLLHLVQASIVGGG